PTRCRASWSASSASSTASAPSPSPLDRSRTKGPPMRRPLPLRPLLLLPFLLAPALPARADASGDLARAPDVTRIDQLLRKTYPADEPGAAVLVEKDGQALLRQGYGMANLELAVPIRPEMVFRIGSITQPPTPPAPPKPPPPGQPPPVPPPPPPP